MTRQPALVLEIVAGQLLPPPPLAKKNATPSATPARTTPTNPRAWRQPRSHWSRRRAGGVTPLPSAIDAHASLSWIDTVTPVGPPNAGINGTAMVLTESHGHAAHRNAQSGGDASELGDSHHLRRVRYPLIRRQKVSIFTCGEAPDWRAGPCAVLPTCAPLPFVLSTSASRGW